MKNLSFFKVLFVALAIFGMSSCGTDDTVVSLGPTVSLADDVDVVSAFADVAPGGTFTVRLSATKGDAAFKSLTVKEDGVNIVSTDNRIAGNGLTVEEFNNPQLITGDDVDGFTWDITVTAHTTSAELDYTFEVEDENGEVGSNFVTINTVSAATDPIVTFIGSDPVTVIPGTAAIVKISAEASSDIASIGVWKAGVLVDLNTEVIDYDGVAMDANPQELEAGSTSLTEAPITIRPTSSGVYTFQVTDVNGLTGSVDVNVIAGTTVSEITGALLNQAGPSGTGGMILATGESVGSADGDIRDSGINSANPDATNWIQTFYGNPGVEVRYASNLPDGSNYDDITTTEAISGAFGSSDVLSGGVTDVVLTGDEFVVNANGVYYYLKVTDVTITTDDNADQYTFSIKK